MAAVVDQTPNKAETSANLFSNAMENKANNEAGVDYSSIRGKVIQIFANLVVNFLLIITTLLLVTYTFSLWRAPS